MIGVLLWAALASGEEPALAVPVDEVPADQSAPVDEEPAPLLRFVEDGQVIHELTVYGDIKVEQARQEVIDALVSEGYTDIEDMGDYLRIRHPQGWKGEVRLYDDGWAHMKRQPVQFRTPNTPWGNEGSVASGLACLLPWYCLKAGGQTISKRKLTGVKVRTLDAMHDEVVELSDAVADRETEERVNELPERLEALWYDGVPLMQDEPVDTMEGRRGELLAYWESRTDTVWGDRVRLAVEAFMRAEVQTSDHPFTAAEVEAFNTRRTCERALDLDSPWEAVTADVPEPW